MSKCTAKTITGCNGILHNYDCIKMNYCQCLILSAIWKYSACCFLIKSQRIDRKCKETKIFQQTEIEWLFMYYIYFFCTNSFFQKELAIAALNSKLNHMTVNII